MHHNLAGRRRVDDAAATCTIRSCARFTWFLPPENTGWMQYYGAFYRSELYPVLKRINGYLARWLRKKYKRLKTFARAHAAWGRLTSQYPATFAHWRWENAHWREG
jgi:Group II intron, maturase-specific domain